MPVKLVKVGIIVLAIMLIAAWLVGSYLGPDDLRGCGDEPSTKAGCERAGAIVAVSGGDTSARAAEAIKLFQQGWGELLIFSGAAADKSGPSNAAVMRQQAIDAGIDVNNIVVEELSETTVENAQETVSIFKSKGVKSAIIVTSAYHQRRATLEFNRRALGVKVRSHPIASDKQWGPLWWLTPTGWALAIPEVVRSLILSTGGIDHR